MLDALVGFREILCGEKKRKKKSKKIMKGKENDDCVHIISFKTIAKGI